MKVATIAVAAAMALSMVPAASAESVYDQNVAYLVNNFEAAGFSTDEIMNDIELVSAVAAQRGVVLSVMHETSPVVPGGPKVGEIWTECFAFFFGSCSPATPVTPNTGIPCVSVPAHWALFVWMGPNNVVEYTGVDLYLWTESHAGTDSLFVPNQSGTAAGSGCLLSNSSSLVVGYHNGVWNP